MDVTRKYEFSMAWYAFNKYRQGVNTPRENFDPGLQNCFYESFALHATNLFHAWRDEYGLLGREFTEEQMNVIRVISKYQFQVFQYPRKEPTYEEKPTFEENELVYKWLMKMAASEGLHLSEVA